MAASIFLRSSIVQENKKYKHQERKQYRETLGKKKNLGFQILAFSTDYGDSIAGKDRKSKIFPPFLMKSISLLG
jgi:hypothetical protein